MNKPHRNIFKDALIDARKELDKIHGEVEYQGAMRILRIIEFYATKGALEEWGLIDGFCALGLGEFRESSLGVVLKKMNISPLDFTSKSEPKHDIQNKYDPNYGDHRLCQCGHHYKRHFDAYSKMAPVTCEFCTCEEFAQKGTE